MTTRPDVSVIFLTYRQAGLVAEAARSILRQEGIVAEVIFSDDGSPDGTFAALQAAVRDYTGPHQIVVRRNRENQGINHIVQVVEAARADTMVMAHGDDVSEPHRCRRLLEELDRTGAYVAGSNCLEIDASGRPAGLSIAAGESRRLEAEEIARTGWQPQMLGGMWYVHEPLLRYRRHAGQWRHVMKDSRTPETFREAEIGALVLAQEAMARDLRHLRADPGGLEAAALERLQGVVDERLRLLCLEWVAARRDLYARGLRPAWMERDTFEAAGRWRGARALREAGRRLFRRLRWELFHR